MGEIALMFWLPATVLIALGTSPVDAPDTLTVGEVWAQRDELDGQHIRVTGVLKGCSHWTCVLAEGTKPGAKYLSIGHPTGYDWEADPLKRHRLIVEGQFKAACLPEESDSQMKDIIVLCTDAARTLLDTKIVKVR